MTAALTRLRSAFRREVNDGGALKTAQRDVARCVRSLYWRSRCLLSPMAQCFRWILYFISGLIPRNKRLWVFGTRDPGISDNAKYLFLYVSSARPDVHAVWISEDQTILTQITSMGLTAVARWSFKGIWLSLRAKYYFYMEYISDVNSYTCRGATRFNLWHGTPLKKIEFDIMEGPSSRRYHNPTWKEKHLTAQYLHLTPTFMLSTSLFVSRSRYSSAFRVPLKRCLELGYPRHDILFWNKEAVLDYLGRIKDREYLDLFDRLACFDRLILYLPTYRDSGDFVLTDQYFDAARLEQLCEAFNAAFLIKLHPDSNRGAFQSKTARSRRIILLKKSLDVYPLMTFADIMITDYSSVMFDFILTRRPIVLYPFDLDNYLRTCRSLYVSFEDSAIGKVVKTSDELCAALRELLSGQLRQNYTDDIINRFYKFPDGNSCKRICEYLLPERK